MSAPMEMVIADEDRLWASNILMKQFHDEFCEYDGAEDGVAVCAAECREFAAVLTGVEPNPGDES